MGAKTTRHHLPVALDRERPMLKCVRRASTDGHPAYRLFVHLPATYVGAQATRSVVEWVHEPFSVLVADIQPESTDRRCALAVMLLLYHWCSIRGGATRPQDSVLAKS